MAQPTLAKAWIGLVPTLDGAQKQIAKELSSVDSAGIGKAHGKKFSAAFKVAAAGLGIIITKVLKDSIGEASDLNESMNAVDVTFGDAAEAVKELGREAATSLGLSNAEFNALAVQFSAFSKTIAGEGGDVAATLDEMTTRASDFASVMNLDVNEAARLFQSGLAGETEPLRKFGIDLSAASVKAYAYANGIAETGAELTEAQKVQARYGSLMEQTGATAGDFVNTSDELANAQRILSAEWKNLQAQIGAKLLPVMKNLVAWGRKIVDWISDNVDWLGPLALGLTAAAVAFWAVNAAMSANPIALIIAGIAALTAGLVWFFTKTEAGKKIWEALTTAFSWAWDNVFHPIMEALVAGWQFLWDNVIQPTVTLIIGIIKVWADTWMWLWDHVISPVVGFMSDAFTAIKNAFGSVVDFFTSAVRTISEIFVKIGKAVAAPFIAAFDAVIAAWKVTQDIISGKKSSLGNLAREWAGLDNLGKNIYAGTGYQGMADGGIVTRPTLRVFGEAGPEAVIPLDRWDETVGSGGGDTYNLYENVSAEATAQAVAARQQMRAA